MESGTKKRQNGGNSASSVNSSRSSSREVKTENSVRTSSATSLSNSQSTMKSQNLLADPSSITGYDLRAHLRQILTFSDDEDFASSDDDCSLNSFEESFEMDESVDAELQKLVGGPPGQDQPPTPKPTTGDNSAALKAIAEEDDLSSEEENEIMREIKNEITNNVRGEMKSELDLYKYKMEKLEREAGGEAGTSEGQKKGAIYEGLDDLEPKLREAIIKMRKLDKILMKRVRREKEVKRDRILLERRIRREIEALNSEKPDEYKEVRVNEQKFLSLELPSRHNEESLSMIRNDLDTDFSDLINTVATEPQPKCEPVSEGSPTVASLTESLTTTETSQGHLTRAEYPQGSLSAALVPLSSPRTHVTKCWGSPSPAELRYLPGVTIPDEFTGEEVFATQLNEEEYPGLHSHRSSGQGKHHSDRSRKGEKGSSKAGSIGGGESESQADSESVTSGSRAGESRRKHKQRGKDFIKRNKELAADAQNLIAMTEEEKKRLEELLADVDTLADVPDQPGDLDEDNPFQIAIKPGEGFHPDADESRSLTSIDNQLRELLPPEEFESIASSSVLSFAPKHKLFTHTGIKHPDWEVRGEKALFQNAEQREMNDRIVAIDSELARIKNPEEELETPRLDADQMRDLVEQCISSLSRSSMSRLTLNSHSRTSMADTESVISHQVTTDTDSVTDSTPRSPRSARQELLENPPKLDPLVLQKLLSEAYHPLSKQLTTLREENEDEDSRTPIPADVWRLISEEQVDGEETESVTGVENGPSLTNRRDKSEKLEKQLSSLSSLSRSSSITSQASAVESAKDFVKGREAFKLPEIDPTGTLVTQGLNNQRSSNHGNTSRLSSGSSRTPVHMVRNSFSDGNVDNFYSDSRMDILSIDGSEMMSPHPPKSEKRESSAGKSRTITPASTRSMAT